MIDDDGALLDERQLFEPTATPHTLKGYSTFATFALVHRTTLKKHTRYIAATRKRILIITFKAHFPLGRVQHNFGHSPPLSRSHDAGSPVTPIYSMQNSTYEFFLSSRIGEVEPARNILQISQLENDAQFSK